MGAYSKTFDWFDFPEGRIRYAGGRRGRDEPPIHIFAVEIYGWIYYGEIRKIFLADGNNYNLEIVSFGWMRDEWFGTEPNPPFCSAFTLKELGEVRALICQVVPLWRELEDRPIVLTEYVDSHFMGDIFLREGWALIKDDEENV